MARTSREGGPPPPPPIRTIEDLEERVAEAMADRKISIDDAQEILDQTDPEEKITAAMLADVISTDTADTLIDQIRAEKARLAARTPEELQEETRQGLERAREAYAAERVRLTFTKKEVSRLERKEQKAQKKVERTEQGTGKKRFWEFPPDQERFRQIELERRRMKLGSIQRKREEAERAGAEMPAQEQYFEIVKQVRDLMIADARREFPGDANKAQFEAELKRIVDETVLKEGIALYDAETKARMQESVSALMQEKVWGSITGIGRWYQSKSFKTKMMISGGLLGGALLTGALTGPAIGLALPLLTRRIIMGVLGGSATTRTAEAFLTRRGEKRGQKEVTRQIERLGRNLNEVLANNNQQLDQLLQQVAEKRGKKAGISRANALVIGAIVGSGMLAPVAAHSAETTGIGKYMASFLSEKFGFVGDISKRIGENFRELWEGRKSVSPYPDAPVAPVTPTPETVPPPPPEPFLSVPDSAPSPIPPTLETISPGELPRLPVQEPSPPYHEAHPAPGGTGRSFYQEHIPGTIEQPTTVPPSPSYDYGQRSKDMPWPPGLEGSEPPEHIPEVTEKPPTRFPTSSYDYEQRSKEMPWPPGLEGQEPSPMPRAPLSPDLSPSPITPTPEMKTPAIGYDQFGDVRGPYAKEIPAISPDSGPDGRGWNLPEDQFADARGANEFHGGKYLEIGKKGVEGALIKEGIDPGDAHRIWLAHAHDAIKDQHNLAEMKRLGYLKDPDHATQKQLMNAYDRMIHRIGKGVVRLEINPDDITQSKISLPDTEYLKSRAPFVTAEPGGRRPHVGISSPTESGTPLDALVAEDTTTPESKIGVAPPEEAAGDASQISEAQIARNTKSNLHMAGFGEKQMQEVIKSGVTVEQTLKEIPPNTWEGNRQMWDRFRLNRINLPVSNTPPQLTHWEQIAGALRKEMTALSRAERAAFLKKSVTAVFGETDPERMRELLKGTKRTIIP